MFDLRRPPVVVTIAFGLVILSILSPFSVRVSFGMFGELYLHIGTILFDFRIGYGISFHDSWIIMQYLLFVVLRPVFAYYFFRYYMGKATVGRVIMSGLFGESPIIAIYLLSAPSGFLSTFVTPLPLHIFVGLSIIICRSIHLPKTPWEKLHEVSYNT